MKSVNEKPRTKKQGTGREKRVLLRMIILLAVLFAGTGCMKKNVASVIELEKSEGEIEIINGRGKDILPAENLHLFQGYMMATQDLSYAWLNLDRARLVKMDEESQIELEKSGKKLEIVVDRGNLFFNIAEPLKDDETLDIRTSSMMVGIRGTCGWVEVLDGGEIMHVYLLEGKVTCETDGRQEMVRAGQMAVLDKNGEIAVSPFTVEDIPAFVAEELEADEALREKIQNASGLDVQNIPEPVDESEPADEPEMPEETENQAGYLAALEQYRIVISQAESYRYDGYPELATGYFYALEKMQAQDTVPTLLLRQEKQGYIDNVRIFQYDPDSGIMHQPEEVLNEGVSGAGGYRGMIGMARDRDGILVKEWSSGTGDTDVTWVTLAGDVLNRTVVWEGRLDRIPGEFDVPELEWYSIRDLSALENWTPDAETAGETGSTAGPGEAESSSAAESSEAESTEAAPLTDGNRIVFGGTINLYTYDQVVSLQGYPDPNGPWSDKSETWRLIVLDAPQAMTIGSADPTAGLGTVNVSMIDVTSAPGLSQYDGQHHTFSIDPNKTYSPSDTSLPLGSPKTNDVRVLE